jgi:hypothetical protein
VRFKPSIKCHLRVFEKVLFGDRRARMAGELEIKGVWWLSDNETQPIPGLLKFSEEAGIRLELDGLLPADKAPVGATLDILLGQSYEGIPITLHESFSTSSAAPSRIISNTLFVGKHFNRVEEIKFTSLRIGFEYLEEWIGGTRFARSTKGRTIKHVRPRGITLKLTSIKAALSLGYRVSGGLDVRSVNYQHTDHIELRPTTRRSYEWFNEKLYVLHMFLVLMMGNAINYTFTVGVGEVVSKVGRRCIREEIKIYRPRSGTRLSGLNWWSLAFRLPDLRDSIEAYLNKWFEDFDVLSPLYDLLWPIVAPPSTYREAIFLNLTQGIETFHRRTVGRTYLPEDDYKPIRDTLIQAIPTGLSEGLRAN